MKRAEQKEKRRQDILNCGLDLFIRNGYAATRTIDIANAVGMSEGLLFHYYETKEQLYLTLIDIALSGRANSFELKATSPLEFFEKVADYIIKSCAEDNFIARLFLLMNQAEHNTALPEDIRSNIAGIREMEETVNIIKQGQADGSIKNGNALALALTFWASLHAVVEIIAKTPQLPVPNPEWLVDIVKNV